MLGVFSSSSFVSRRVALTPCVTCEGEHFASLVKSVLSLDHEKVKELLQTGVSVNMALREAQGNGMVWTFVREKQPKARPCAMPRSLKKGCLGRNESLWSPLWPLGDLRGMSLAQEHKDTVHFSTLLHAASGWHLSHVFFEDFKRARWARSLQHHYQRHNIRQKSMDQSWTKASAGTFNVAFWSEWGLWHSDSNWWTAAKQICSRHQDAHRVQSKHQPAGLERFDTVDATELKIIFWRFNYIQSGSHRNDLERSKWIFEPFKDFQDSFVAACFAGVFLHLIDVGVTSQIQRCACRQKNVEVVKLPLRYE